MKSQNVIITVVAVVVLAGIAFYVFRPGTAPELAPPATTTAPAPSATPAPAPATTPAPAPSTAPAPATTTSGG